MILDKRIGLVRRANELEWFSRYRRREWNKKWNYSSLSLLSLSLSAALSSFIETDRGPVVIDGERNWRDGRPLSR